MLEANFCLGLVVLLQLKPNLIFSLTKDGQNIVHVAAQNEHERLVRFALTREPTLTAGVDRDGRTVLHKAYHSEALVRYILAIQPNLINVFDHYFWNVAALAADTPNDRLVQFLLNASPQLINRVENIGRTILHIAVLRQSFLFDRISSQFFETKSDISSTQ